MTAQYADLKMMQCVRVVGSTLHDDNRVTVTLKNTMDNLNVTYKIPLREFLSRRFEEVRE